MKRNNDVVYNALNIMDKLRIAFKFKVDEENVYRDTLNKIKEIIKESKDELLLPINLRLDIESFINDIKIKNLNKKILDILYENGKLDNKDEENIKLLDLNNVHLLKLLCKILSGVSYSQRGNLLLLKYNKSIWYIGWNEYYMACRGKVIDINTNQIITYPFDKFFNLNEVNETRIEHIQTILENAEYISLTDKIDGSIISMSKYKGKILITSNGGFENEGINKAKKLINDKYTYFRDNLKEGYTYIFEIIYPEDKKVVDYGNEEKLILLAIRDLKTEILLRYEDCKRISLELSLELVENMVYTSLEELIFKAKNLKKSNKEGWVLRIISKDSDVMLKIKLEEYCRIHRVVLSDLNLFSVYNLIYNNQLDDVLANVNELVKEDILKIVNKIFILINDIEKDLRDNLDILKEKFDITREEFIETSTNKNHPKYDTRKELMVYVNKNCSRYYTSAGIHEYYTSEKEVEEIVRAIDVKTLKRICKKENIDIDND